MQEEKKTKGKIKKKIDNPQVDGILKEDLPETTNLSSYDIFKKCIKRAENLVSFHAKTEELEDISEQHYCDCYRAAIVLSISALDAFIRTIIISEIRKKIIEKNIKLPDKLCIYIKSLMNQDMLLEAARNYNILEKCEEVIKFDFEKKSFQGDLKISNFFNMVDHKDIFSKVAEKADVSERNLRRKLNLFTKRRHIIAHSGDYDLNQTPIKEKEITKDHALKCIDIVTLFAKNIDELIGD